jgi:hypothetical protein
MNRAVLCIPQLHHANHASAGVEENLIDSPLTGSSLQVAYDSNCDCRYAYFV